ncbi:MAG: hypothetical protein V1647_07230, partial [Pseudomonadota bacterium]
KKILLLGAVMFAFSLSATTVKEYVTNDLTNMKTKTTDTNTTISARYTEMSNYVSKVNVGTVKTKISKYCGCINTPAGCTGKGLDLETFDYTTGGKPTHFTNALILYRTKTNTKDTEPKGKRWFVSADECGTFTDLGTTTTTTSTSTTTTKTTTKKN